MTFTGLLARCRFNPDAMFNKNKQLGFSLLEVLVAFSIFAISFTMILQIFSKGSRSAQLSSDYATAVIVAESTLNSIGIVSFPEPGVYQQDNGKYQVSTSIEEIKEDSESESKPTVALRDIALKVSWKNRGKSHTVSLDTVKIFPVE
ncbi:MAG: prepilin-type N-terminal cleavage/methylation domain-containing protein [Gammaproteobacteria bacterium]|nr:prepilin-type N-terminal cleavage/methylation domain-containing protein [Gammaproteobacteria bacterium]